LAAVYCVLPPTRANEGTGFFIAATGEVITNKHVVNACDQITITGYGFHGQRATLAAVDAEYDLAILRTGITPPAILPIAADPWGSSEKTVLAALRRDEFGQGTIIGYHGRSTTLETDGVGLPTKIITDDRRHFYRLATGLFIQGESGSPILYPSGQVAGVLFHADQLNWTRQTADGMEGNTGLFLPGPVVRDFALSKGVNLVTAAPPQPERAVVHVFCLQN
jgi:S1-C subfamily serine protease